MNKNIIILIVILGIIAGAAYWYWTNRAVVEPEISAPQITGPSAPAPTLSAPAEDTTSAIDQDLQNIDIGNEDEGLQNIDTELNNL